MPVEDRSRMLLEDLSFDEISEVMLHAPDDYWISWFSDFSFFPLMSRLRLVAIASEIPPRSRVTMTGPDERVTGSQYVGLSIGQLERLSRETRALFVTSSGQFCVANLEAFPIVETRDLEVLRPLVDKGLLRCTPLTREENVGHQAALWTRNPDGRCDYPRRAKPNAKKTKTKE
jgi:hypothetical protein